MSDIEALKDLLDEIRLEAGGLRTRLADKEERRAHLRAHMAATILSGMLSRGAWEHGHVIACEHTDRLLAELGL